MDILLHNLSHSDMLLGVVVHKAQTLHPNDVHVVRPKFSKFHCISKFLFDHIVQNISSVKIFSSALHNRHSSNETNGSSEEKLHSVPVGFDLRGCPALCDVHDVRFRKDILDSEENSSSSLECHVHFVYFPLLAVLLKRWLQHTSFSQLHLILVSGRGKPIDQSSQDVDNSTQFTGHLVAQFVKLTLEYSQLLVHLIHSDTNLFRYDENILFVKRELLPVIQEMRRQIVAQKKDKWREFMRMTLSFADGSSARISAINQSLKIYQPAYMHFWSLKSFWREQKIYADDVEFHTYEEIATEPAMRLKDLTDPLVIKAVEEIDRFHTEFETVAASSDNDLRSFWLRKTMKAVLAVLIVEKPTGEIVAYRGTNLEVSLPTGSLCAERNAIGTAFAADMSLKREDIKLVAVYSAAYEEKKDKKKKPLVLSIARNSETGDAAVKVEVVTQDTVSTSSTSASSSNTLSSPISTKVYPHDTESFPAPLLSTTSTHIASPKSQQQQQQQQQQKQQQQQQRQVSNSGRTRAILQINDQPLPLSPNTSHNRSRSATTGSDTTAAAAVSPSHGLPPLPPSNLKRSLAPSATLEEDTADVTQSQKKRRKMVPFSSPEAVSHHNSSTNLSAMAVDDTSATHSNNQDVLCTSSAEDAAVSSMLISTETRPCEWQQQRLATMETIETGESDLNPLKPCGTCTSWLRKIVKCNPDFRVVTFTDARRQGIYVEYVQE